MAIWGCGSPAHCCQPPVNLLSLEALFMQISRVSLALTWPCRLCLLWVLLCGSLCYKLSPFQAHWGRWHCTSFLRPACLFIVHVRSGSSLLSCGVFLPLLLLQAFLLLVAGRVLLLLPSPAGLFIYSSMKEFPSPPSALRAPRPLCYMSGLLLLLNIQVFFFFFPWVGVGVQGAMLIWPRIVCGSTVYRLAHLVIRFFLSCLVAAVWRWRGSPPGFSI
jgi:hypothetical protein